MKKLLTIAAIGVTCALPAYAVQKCVALTSATTCVSSMLAGSLGSGAADWSSSCATNGTSVSLKGVGGCSKDTITGIGGTLDKLTVSTTSTNNVYCWCKMTSPAVSPWVAGNTYSSYTLCIQNCANYCAPKDTQNSLILSAMVSNMSD